MRLTAWRSIFLKSIGPHLKDFEHQSAAFFFFFPMFRIRMRVPFSNIRQKFQMSWKQAFADENFLLFHQRSASVWQFFIRVTSEIAEKAGECIFSETAFSVQKNTKKEMQKNPVRLAVRRSFHSAPHVHVSLMEARPYNVMRVSQLSVSLLPW